MNGIFSPCGLYRHMLVSPGAHMCAWVMVNPSIAGSRDDWTGVVVSDPTADRVREFSRSWGYDGFVIVNVYDLVSTDPKVLKGHPARCSEVNDLYLLTAASCPLIVVAWGKNAAPEDAARTASILRSQGNELWSLGTNIDGSPPHPLYLRHDTKLQRWTK